jgi:hypothetical protein
VEQAAAASQSIVDQAQALNDLIEHYHVDEGSGVTTAGAMHKRSAAPAATERRSEKRPWAKPVKGKSATTSTPRVPAGKPAVRKAVNSDASGDSEWNQF